MATIRTLRSKKYLRCFYCGQRSTVRFEGQKSFECANCDATNWLDQDGEITDPPAPSENLECNRVQYAIPRFSAARSLSPPLMNTRDESQAKESDPVFCDTCVRNQYMLSSSLAQFEWPDDATSSEYAARERKYFALRKDLEKRYPQVCLDCIPKVNQKIQQASYTAQTDHLRRMIERTQSRRAEVKKRGLLDIFDGLGKLCWYAGFALQAVWHVVVLCSLLTDSYHNAVEGDPWLSVALGSFHRLSAAMLPYSERFMQWAINLGVCSFPWNPRFKQSIRGFTAHIVGFRQWYTYQLLVLFVRFVSLSVAQYSVSRGISASTQLSAQLIIPLVMVRVFLTAKKVIHTDTTPLFRRPTEVTAAASPESRDGPTMENANDLGSVLDEILHSPRKERNGNGQAAATLYLDSPPSSPEHDSDTAFSPPRPTVPHASSRHGPPSHRDEDEMDWSPSGSQHRAFSTYNLHRVKNPNPRFNDTPIEQRPGPIWYKVPPAPTSPAQRLRNPPMRPIIRESPKGQGQGQTQNFFQPTERQAVNFGGKTQSTLPDIAPPRFFAPEPANDPRDNLSRMFATSFSLSPDPEETDVKMEPVPDRTMGRVVELVALLASLGGWIFALDTGEKYGRSVALAAVCVYLIVSIRLAADLEVDQQIRGGNRPSMLSPSLANLALGQVITVLLLMWSVWSGTGTWVSSGVYGNTLFGSVIIHHMWHIFHR
ncbi:hypothetical protein GGS20DRAFT_589990 [Poronia punctata]|nr:hypothetical protein GGS20DRAFT_589990 [Poronia punctata]